MAILQRLDNVLAVAFTCQATDVVGDVVQIKSDNTVEKVDDAGSTKIVGTVVKKITAGEYGWDGAATTCTVETRFRCRRDDRISGAAIAVGPFVFDGDMKAIAYSSASHSPAAIAGLCIKSANAGDVAIETLEY
jgi:hypothetical protein